MGTHELAGESASEGSEAFARFFEAMEKGDAETLSQLVHEDVVMEWPQSGERFRGRENAFAAMAGTEIKPEPAGEPRIVGCGNVWVVMMPLRYGQDDIHHYVGVYEMERGRIIRSTEYFGAPFSAQEGRGRYAEPR